MDYDQDGDLDVLVACMGKVFPSNDKIGSVVILPLVALYPIVERTFLREKLPEDTVARHEAIEEA